MNHDFTPVGKWLVVAGVALLTIGLLLIYLPQVGKLPGDVVVGRKKYCVLFSADDHTTCKYVVVFIVVCF